MYFPSSLSHFWLASRSTEPGHPSDAFFPIQQALNLLHTAPNSHQSINHSGLGGLNSTFRRSLRSIAFFQS
uniref:Uncharacterized protein n=1 Tax=Picea glauca TaxID=3330 RepID=A0A101M3T1_PICGL|nr:hypothetical protein ABT39_MTgene395 [Picea glauca]QHR92195.1 hypothetical protein Q903MT_gene6232 [Picea sitchensis]